LKLFIVEANRIESEDYLLKENHKRPTSPIILTIGFLALASNSLLAQNYITKEGQEESKVFKLWTDEEKAGRNPRKASKERGWEP
jgi:hypothetical protein